jgi:hypothetical protein
MSKQREQYSNLTYEVDGLSLKGSHWTTHVMVVVGKIMGMRDEWKRANCSHRGRALAIRLALRLEGKQCRDSRLTLLLAGQCHRVAQSFHDDQCGL